MEMKTEQMMANLEDLRSDADKIEQSVQQMQIEELKVTGCLLFLSTIVMLTINSLPNSLVFLYPTKQMFLGVYCNQTVCPSVWVKNYVP